MTIIFNEETGTYKMANTKEEIISAVNGYIGIHNFAFGEWDEIQPYDGISDLEEYIANCGFLSITEKNL